MKHDIKFKSGAVLLALLAVTAFSSCTKYVNEGTGDPGPREDHMFLANQSGHGITVIYGDTAYAVPNEGEVEMKVRSTAWMMFPRAKDSLCFVFDDTIAYWHHVQANEDDSYDRTPAFNNVFNSDSWIFTSIGYNIYKDIFTISVNDYRRAVQQAEANVPDAENGAMAETDFQLSCGVTVRL